MAETVTATVERYQHIFKLPPGNAYTLLPGQVKRTLPGWSEFRLDIERVSGVVALFFASTSDDSTVFSSFWGSVSTECVELGCGACSGVLVADCVSGCPGVTVFGRADKELALQTALDPAATELALRPVPANFTFFAHFGHLN